MTYPSRKTVEHIKQEYPKGTLVELVKMDDPYAPPIGTIGEVVGVDDMGSLMMHWHNGSSLNVVYEVDIVKKI